VASDNVELVKRAFEAFNDGGTEAFIPYAHPEIEFSTPSDLASEPDTYRGHEGVRRYWDSFFEIMEDIKVVPNELYERSGLVVADMTLKATGRATGIEAEQQVYAVLTVADDKAIGISFHPTLKEAEAEADAG
jgi:ketosteroid isomerase-like protein